MQEIIDFYNFVLNFENFCEKTKDASLNKEIFSVKFKILFFIYFNKQLSPSDLVEMLNMAKSNIALFCKQLLQEQLIISRSDELDHRVIYYCLTKKGQKYVDKLFESLGCFMKGKFKSKDITDMHNSIKRINKIFLKAGD